MSLQRIVYRERKAGSFCIGKTAIKFLQVSSFFLAEFCVVKFFCYLFLLPGGA
jgi:hypothetical protein